MKESEYLQKDVNYKRVAFLVTVVLAITAWVHHADLREKEFQKAYYEQRIKAINNVFEVVKDIDTADTEEKKLKASKEFWLVHYGYSIAYLNPEMHSALEPVTDYINKCIQKLEVDYSVDCRHSIQMYLSGFSSIARKELAKGWDINFDEILVSHPWDKDIEI